MADPPPNAQPPASKRGRLLVALLWATIFLILLGIGLRGDLSVEEAAQQIASLGALGALGYLAAFALLQPAGLSGHALTLAAALIWPWPIAIPLALAGAVGAAVVSYLLARYVAYDWVQARLPQRVRKYEGWLIQRGLLGVIGFRVFTFTLQPAMLMLGVMRIRFTTMLAGTIIGFAPQIFVDVLLGGEAVRTLLDWLGVS